MSVLKYGAVRLKIIKTNGYKWEAVYAGRDYLYTQHTLSVRAIFNPSVQSDQYRGDNIPQYGPGNQLPPNFRFPPAPIPQNPPAPIGPFVGSRLGVPQDRIPGAYTAEAVKHELMQPRLQLGFWIEGIPVLISPLPGYVVDAANGPKPISCDVVEIQGARTFVVDYVVQTYVNECIRFTNGVATADRVILSHQWSQEDILDEDFYDTRVTVGRVVFRSDLLYPAPWPGNRNRIHADQFRRSFLLPVPPNMKRSEVRVKVEEDGVTVNYVVVDKEMALNWSVQGITRVEATHEVVNATEIGQIPFLGINALDWTARLSTWIQSVFPSQRQNQAEREMLGNMALSLHKISVHVWGDRNAIRGGPLETFARDLVRIRMSPFRQAGISLTTIASFLKHELVKNEVEGYEVYRGGPLTPLGGFLPNQLVGRYVFQAGGGGAVNDTGTLLIASSQTQIPAPADDNVGRDTFLRQLVVAALSTPCNRQQTFPPAPEPDRPPPANQPPQPPPPQPPEDTGPGFGGPVFAS